MNLRKAIFLLVLVASGCRSPSTSAPPPTTTEEKIELLAEAFSARDRGDLEGAKARLEQLLLLTPGDATIRRVLAQIEADLAAPPPAREPAPVVVPAPAQPPAASPPPQSSVPLNAPGGISSSRPQTPTQQPPSGTQLPVAPAAPQATGSVPPAGGTFMPPVIVERVPGAQPPPPLDAFSLAMARVEAAGAAFAQSPSEVEKLMTYMEAQRALARLYAADERYMTAARTITAMLTSMDHYLDELRSERYGYYRDEVKSRQGVRMKRRR